MGKRTDYDLRGWGPNGRFLSAFEKEEIQDLVFDEGMDDYGCSSRDNEPEIMSFGSEYYGAYEDVQKALSDYAHRNPEVLLELKYDCDDDDEHQLIRFKGDEVEEHNRFETFPSFVKLTSNGDSNPLPVIEFNFEAVDDEPAASILVLLDHCPDKDTLAALEDSISSYIDSIPAYGYEQLIHDVLWVDGIGHWILKPTHTFNI